MAKLNQQLLKTGHNGATTFDTTTISRMKREIGQINTWQNTAQHENVQQNGNEYNDNEYNDIEQNNNDIQQNDTAMTLIRMTRSVESPFKQNDTIKLHFTVLYSG